MTVGWLGCHFGCHPLTRFRTLSTDLDAPVYQLIVSCHLLAILPTLRTQVGTEAADPIVKRRLTKHVVNRGRAHLCTVHQEANVIGGSMAPP
ncbi:MAG: hypothetical protein Nkreftii_000496 [Candidatus Nitrospira kreftii]|uniref:Uncharacterized protein n=1 Tax=Candidatus Nitrospira kreftii TaxID=2652173 RepID=A0A7S8FBI3_9BACT|nr:MAG: hypothetical protein Nkreftii_000496 [Candidatus Nitrospira kreftii]